MEVDDDRAGKAADRGVEMADYFASFSARSNKQEEYGKAKKFVPAGGAACSKVEGFRAARRPRVGPAAATSIDVRRSDASVAITDKEYQ